MACTFLADRAPRRDRPGLSGISGLGHRGLQIGARRSERHPSVGCLLQTPDRGVREGVGTSCRTTVAESGLFFTHTGQYITVSAETH